jgi:hypothetical protein
MRFARLEIDASITALRVRRLAPADTLDTVLVTAADIAAHAAVCVVDLSVVAKSIAADIRFIALALTVCAVLARPAFMVASSAIVLVDEDIAADRTAAELLIRASFSTLMAVVGIDRDFDALPGTAGFEAADAAVSDAELTVGAVDRRRGLRSVCQAYGCECGRCERGDETAARR